MSTPCPTVGDPTCHDFVCDNNVPQFNVVRQLPCSEEGRIINVYQSCIDDVCTCAHTIGGNFALAIFCSQAYALSRAKQFMLYGMGFVMASRL